MAGLTGFGVSLGKLAVTQALRPNKAQGSVIILHGSCDSGAGMKVWLQNILHSEFAFPNYRVLYPSAPSRPYTLMNGQVTVTAYNFKNSVGIWFDRLSLGPEYPEDRMTLEPTASALSELIVRESEVSGVPLSKTIIGGFSMGGTMAFHVGYRLHPRIAGVFALSSSLHPDSRVYKHLESREKSREERTVAEGRTPKASPSSADFDSMASPSKTPTIDQIYRNIKTAEEKNSSALLPRLFMSHGSRDPLVRYPWAKSTFTKLREHGVEGYFHTLPHLQHDIEISQLSLLHDWIHDVLSTNSSNSPQNKKLFKEKKTRHVNDDLSIPAYDW